MIARWARLGNTAHPVPTLKNETLTAARSVLPTKWNNTLAVVVGDVFRASLSFCNHSISPSFGQKTPMIFSDTLADQSMAFSFR